MTTHEVLVAARNLIDREGWIQASRGPDGAACAGNAIHYASDNCASGSRGAHDAFARANGFTAVQIVSWNDAPGRTKAEVLAAFDKAIAATAPPPPDPTWSDLTEDVEREPVRA